jgi:hypothetical protein
MTILFGNAEESFQDELSSRPERSVVEGSAVRPSDFPNSGAKVQSSPRRHFSPCHRKTCPKFQWKDAQILNPHSFCALRGTT